MDFLKELKRTLQIGMSQDNATLEMLQQILQFVDMIEIVGIAERKDTERFEIACVAGDTTSESLKGLKFTIGEGFLGHVVATGQPGYWQAISQDPRASFFVQNGIYPTDVLCIPIVRRQEVFGVLFAVSSREIKRDTINFLEPLSLILGRQMLIESMEEDLQVQNIRLSSIVELSQAMLSVTDIKNILYILLDMSLNMVQGPFTCIAFKPLHQESAVELFSRGIARQKAAEYGRKLTDSYIGRSIRDFENQIIPVIRSTESNNIIECPLFVRDEIIAVLAVAVGNKSKIEEFTQLVYVLSVIGAAALQHLQVANVDDWVKDIALLHRVSEYWDKDAYHHSIEVQELAMSSAEKFGLCGKSVKSIEQAALLLPIDAEFVIGLLSGIAENVIHVLRDYQAIANPCHTVPADMTIEGQILALADFHLGNTDIQINSISDDLRNKFELFMLQKDVESQQIPLRDSKRYESIDADSLLELPSLEQLTAREQEVLELLVTGMGNKEIAQTLFISEHTVKNHLTNIFQKLGVNDRAQAIAFVYRYIQ